MVQLYIFVFLPKQDVGFVCISSAWLVLYNIMCKWCFSSLKVQQKQLIMDNKIVL
uniref:Uncharacterized protein n=1 Tax=Anguilla anguilla TaxID=7936 RepID=A0A0E9X3W5_ANGAN